MAISKRETYILVANDNGLFPADFVYPADDLFPSGEIREITNIVAGSLSLSEILSETPIQLGQMYASKFECEVYLEEDLSGKFIHVYQQNDGVYSDVFSGYIDSCKLDKIGTDRKLVAYDLAYKYGQTNVAEWWEQFWENKTTATLKQVKDSLISHVGLYYADDAVLPNDNLVVTKTVALSTCSFAVMLKMICELECSFPRMTRDGFIDFIILDTDQVAIDVSNNLEYLNCEFEDFVTDAITGVQFFDSGNQLKWTVGQAENAYPISKNIFLYTADENTLQTVGNTILGYLRYFQYTPSKVKLIVSDLSLELGTKISAGNNREFYILNNYVSGSQFIEQEISAPGVQKQYEGTPTLDYGELVLNERIARVGYDLNNFYVEYGQYKQSVDGTLESYGSRLNINETAITAEVNNRQVAIAESFADYKGTITPTASTAPAVNWTTDAQKKEHVGEIYYDTQAKKYYEWYVTTNSSGAITSYGWRLKNVNSVYDLVVSTANSKVNLTSSEFTVELNSEKTARELADATSFANYVYTYVPTTSNVPASGWTTDAQKKAHVGEVFYNKNTKKYYQWYVTLNSSGAVTASGWNEKTNLSSVYDLVTTTTDSKLQLTDTSFTVAISTEKTARETADLKATYNYTGTVVPTNNNSPASSWTTTELKKSHVGEVYYKSNTKDYYIYKENNGVYGWEATGAISTPFDLVTRSRSSRIDMTDEQISLEVTRATTAEHMIFANYSGNYVPTLQNAPAVSWTTQQLAVAHNGETFYNTATGKYYRYVVTVVE